MTDSRDPTTSAASPSRDKDLWRQTAQSRVRERIQPNFGRIQQEGKAAYCLVPEGGEYLPKVVEPFFENTPEPIWVWVSLATAEWPRRSFAPLRWMKHWLIRKPFVITRGFASAESEPHDSRIGFLARACRLEKLGQVDAALDLVYDQIDEMLNTGKLEQVNRLLANAEVGSLSADVLLGLLTVTLPARSKLPARGPFFQEVAKVLKHRQELEEGLLVGLES
jgi:hypothetical protein